MNLTDPKALRAFLDSRGLSARKGLGQHFLCSPSAVRSIVSRIDGVQGILEIGPGPGVLTQALCEDGRQVIALEIDAEMAGALAVSAPRADVRRVDALKADLAQILHELPKPSAVVSNLPYYITARLTIKIAEAKSHYAKAVLMMQREVGMRFMALPGNAERGSISVYLQALFEIKKVADVPRSAFMPAPKVDSMVLEFVPLSGTDFSDGFFEFVQQGFLQPRKTLANNLSSFDRGLVQAALASLGLPERVRPHELDLDGWQSLWDHMFRLS